MGRQAKHVYTKGPTEINKNNSHTLTQNHKGSIAYLDTIEKSNPGYTRSLFRYAQKLQGTITTFQELAATMNQKISTDPTKPTTLISRLQINIWFIKEGGT